MWRASARATVREEGVPVGEEALALALRSKSHREALRSVPRRSHSSSLSNATRSRANAYDSDVTLTPRSAYDAAGYARTSLRSAPRTSRDIRSTVARTSNAVERGARRFTRYRTRRSARNWRTASAQPRSRRPAGRGRPPARGARDGDGRPEDIATSKAGGSLDARPRGWRGPARGVARSGRRDGTRQRRESTSRTMRAI